MWKHEGTPLLYTEDNLHADWRQPEMEANAVNRYALGGRVHKVDISTEHVCCVV
jgi:hypothetical protein